MAYIVDEFSNAPKTKKITIPGTGGVQVTTATKAPASKTTLTLAGLNVPKKTTNPTPGPTNPTPGPGGGGGAVTNGDYYSKLMQAKSAGIMSEYEANASVIKNNLAKALANLESEKAALAPVYQQTLQNIAQNQFASGEQMKEMMNQAGWTGQNSGIAIGEQGKIKIGADNARNEARGQYDQGVMDINRRTTLAKQVADEDKAALEKWKNAQMRGAEAEAWLSNQDRLDQIAAQNRSYSASMAAAAIKQKQAADEALSKTEAANKKAQSWTVRRSNVGEIDTAYAKGDIKTLLLLQQAIAQDEYLTADDYSATLEYLNSKLDRLTANMGGFDAEEEQPAEEATPVKKTPTKTKKPAPDYGAYGAKTGFTNY